MAGANGRITAHCFMLPWACFHWEMNENTFLGVSGRTSAEISHKGKIHGNSLGTTKDGEEESSWPRHTPCSSDSWMLECGLGLHCQCAWIWNHLGDTPLDRSGRLFTRGVSEKGKCTLNVHGTIPWVEVPDLIKRGKRRHSGLSIATYSSLASDGDYNMISYLGLLPHTLHQHDGLSPQTMSQITLSCLSCSCQMLFIVIRQ